MSSLLNFIGQQITIYVGIPMFIAGVTGNCLTIIVFLSLKTFRQSSCAFYLTVLSFMNIGQLITGLLSRLLISGFNIDWTRSSLAYCKIRPFIVYVSALISSACLYLATIDQYFSTRTHPRWQHWSNIKLAHRLLAILSIFYFLEQLPLFAVYNIVISSSTNQTSCIMTNNDFAQFHAYFNVIILWFILPLILTLTFAVLTYRNVKHYSYRKNPLARRELDKQLTIMVLRQVLVNFLTNLPFIVSYALLINNNIKSNPIVYAGVNFAYTIGIYSFYVSFSCPFYIYICASERFRRQFVYVIFNVHLNRVQQRLVANNQIAAIA